MESKKKKKSKAGRRDLQRPFQPVDPAQGLPFFTTSASSRKSSGFYAPMMPDRGCAM